MVRAEPEVQVHPADKVALAAQVDRMRRATLAVRVDRADRVDRTRPAALAVQTALAAREDLAGRARPGALRGSGPVTTVEVGRWAVAFKSPRSSR